MMILGSLITHDLGVVAGIADRVQVMYAGTMVETGAVHQVFSRPRMPYTVGLLSSIPRPDSIGLRLRPIKGAPPSLINMPPGCPFSPRCPLAQADCDESEPVLEPVEDALHLARCKHWEEVAATADPRSLFDTSSDADALLPDEEAIMSEKIAE